MKRAASVFLLSVFLFSIAGVFGLFSWLKHVNYESVFERDSNVLTLLRFTIPKTEVIYWEEENEMVYRGKYYDVFSKAEDDKNYFFICYSDSKEDLLCDTFDKYVKNQQSENADGKNSGDSSGKTIIQDFILQPFLWNVQISEKGKMARQMSFLPGPGFTSVFSPPPELV